jgi:HSP20 family protein
MRLARRETGWNPMREFEEMSKRFENMLAQWPFSSGEREELALADWAPAVNISESNEAYMVEAELPNVDKDHVKVTVDQGMLTIQGERKEEKEDKGKKFHRREMTYGNFMRRFTLPEDADDTNIDAQFQNGVLHVTIPRTEPQQPKRKQIEVK